MLRYDIHDVTATSSEGVLHPELVKALEDIGFVRVGQLEARPKGKSIVAEATYSHEDHERFMKHLRRPPRQVMTPPDGSAFVGVDDYFGRPVVRFHSLLDTGSLVETIGAMRTDLPNQARPAHAGMTDLALLVGNSANRQIYSVGSVEPTAVFTEHRANLDRYTTEHGGSPTRHESMAQAVELWQRSADHTAAVNVRLMRLTVIFPMIFWLVISILLLAGINAIITALFTGNDMVASLSYPISVGVAFIAGSVITVLMSQKLSKFATTHPNWNPKFV